MYSMLSLLIASMAFTWWWLTPREITQASTISYPLCGTWHSIITAEGGGAGSGLHSIAVISPTDVWAVGSKSTLLGPLILSNQEEPLFLHWDGKVWQPNNNIILDAKKDIQLNSLAGSSSDNVWAVGSYSSGAMEQAILIHWDGTNWSEVSSPNVGSYSSGLNSITMVSSNDAWAVGYYRDSSLNYHPLTLHWNGHDWAVIPAVTPVNKEALLHGVAAMTRDEVWAVGSTSDSSGQTAPLVLHWIGNEWKVMKLPSDIVGVSLNAVTVLSPTNVWAVGSGLPAYNKMAAVNTTGVILHWNGAGWEVVAKSVFRN